MLDNNQLVEYYQAQLNNFIYSILQKIQQQRQNPIFTFVFLSSMCSLRDSESAAIAITKSMKFCNSVLMYKFSGITDALVIIV